MLSEAEIAKIVAEVIKELSKDIYADALKPATQEIGKALGTVFGLGNVILTPFELAIEGTKLLKESVITKWESKLKALPPEKIKAIEPEIAVPALSKLKYTTNDELQNLFLNLLTSASNTDKSSFVHPSFINVISNLSPDEAKIINYMVANNEPSCTVHIRIHYQNETFSDHAHNTTIFDANELIEFKNNTSVYLHNLISLGIIKKWSMPTNVPQLDLIKEFLNPTKETLQSEKSNVVRVEFIDRFYDFTEYGKQFMDICKDQE